MEDAVERAGLTPKTQKYQVDAHSRSALRRQRDGLRDVADGLALWRLSATLAWLDIKLKYRGSVLGPFWLTISTAVMIVTLGTLYSTLFHMDVHQYLPFLALSLVAWNTLSGLIGDSCTTFTVAEGTMRTTRMPFSVHAIRVVVRGAIQLAHNVPVIIAVFAWFDTWPGLIALRTIPAFLLWGFDSFALCFLLGALCLRFRDIPPIVASIMQIMFFVTPIVWRPEQLGRHAWWLPLNPFFSLLEIIRAPLLGLHAGWHAYAYSAGYSAVLILLAIAVFGHVRGRLTFWL
jgi:lipopolysaccharide transport system permease protein